MNDVQTQIFKDAEGIQQAYLLMLEEEVLDIICLANNYAQVIGQFYEETFSPLVYGKKQSREILPNSPANRAESTTKNVKLNQVRFVTPQSLSESDVLIGKNRAALISFATDHPLAIVISDPELVSNLKLQFDLAWKAASA